MGHARIVGFATVVFLGACSLVVESELDSKRGRDAGDTSEDAGAGTDSGGSPDGGTPPDGGSPADAGGDGGTGSDAGGECSGSHACVPEAPAGWTGPSALFVDAVGADVPACAGAYPSSVGTYNGDLDPGTATCSCECDPATGISCTGRVRFCYGSGVTFCTAFCLASSYVDGPVPSTCSSVSTSGDRVRVSYPAPASHGSCTSREAHSIPAPQWGTVGKACGGATEGSGSCDGGEVCMPVPASSFGSLCVYQPGDVECPTEYPNRHLFYEDFEDTRACSACSCGAATSNCEGKVDFVNGTGGPCSVLEASVTSCGIHSSAPQAIYSPDPSGTCPPSTSSLSGSVTTSGAITFCCQSGS